MQYRTIVPLALLSTTISALTITSPSSGSSLDPTKQITVTWTSTTSDPSTFDLVLDNSFGTLGGRTVATDVSTASGSYTIAANALTAYGTGYDIIAQSSDGTELASTGSILLVPGVGSQSISTASNGQVSLVSVTSTAYTGYPASSASGTWTTTGSAASSAHTTAVAGNGTVMSVHSYGNSTVTSATHMNSTSFATSTKSSSLSSSHSSSSVSRTAASTSATSSANAQNRVVGCEGVVLSVAGVLAGVFALLA